MRLLPWAVFAATFAAFVPALQNAFVNWDDAVNFTQNPHYRGLGLAQLRWMLTHFHSAHYMPLTWLTLGLDYSIWGMNPFGYHLGNVLLHAANAVLVYLIARRLLAGPASAAFAALFFSLHPLRVESVAWATERRDVLSGFFYLLCLKLYLEACSRSPKPKLGAALAACVMALLSKVTAITLPAALLVLDYYPLRRRALKEKLPFAACALAAGIVGLFAQNDDARTLAPLSEIGLLARLGHAAYGLVFYAQKTFVPTGLSPWYEPGSLSAPYALYCAALASAVLAIAWRDRRKLPWFWAACLFYAAVLFPAVGLVQSGRQLAADRYSYLPCLPWALLAAAGLEARKALRLPAALLLAGLAAMTWRYCEVWRDTSTLWTYALSVDPDSPFAHQSLAVDFMEKGRPDLAVAEMERARLVSRAPYLAKTEAKALNNLGVDLAGQGLAAEAESKLKDCLRLDPTLASARNNLGLILYKKGDAAGAAREFSAALKTDPGYAEARKNLAAVLARRGRRP